MTDFPKFDSVPRLNRTAVITEKIDGTNGLVSVTPDLLTTPHPGKTIVEVISGYISVTNENNEVFEIMAGSRSRWLNHKQDNFGFWHWVVDHAQELVKLGEGRHYGEWYGKGIQRGYGLDEKRFMLFNSERWEDPDARPWCCEVATVLGHATVDLSGEVERALGVLRDCGSQHVPGWDQPEGVVFYHTAARQYFKATLVNDELPKALAEQRAAA